MVKPGINEMAYPKQIRTEVCACVSQGARRVKTCQRYRQQFTHQQSILGLPLHAEKKSTEASTAGRAKRCVLRVTSATHTPAEYLPWDYIYKEGRASTEVLLRAHIK